jgi:enterobactin synthetase component D / holo-[acyl-carrier protein] synthase
MPAVSGMAAGPLARLLDDPRIVVAELDPRQVAPEVGLFPEEAAPLSRAVLSRRQQFTAGRLLARQAWSKLGQAPVPLLNDAQRVPLWPQGLVGTITHTVGWCAVAVARQSEVEGLGADVEPATPLQTELWERVCRPEERRLLEALDPDQGGLLAKGIFSAKESIYKALYPRVRVFLDFQGMSIELEATGAGGGRADAGATWLWRPTLQTSWGPFQPGHRFPTGRLWLDSELIVSAVVL